MRFRDLFRRAAPLKPLPAPPFQQPTVAAELVTLFRDHDVEVEIQDETVILTHTPYQMEGRIVREQVQHKTHSVQLDIRFHLNPETMLVESFAGLGSDRVTAIRDSLENLTRSSFHVILRAFVMPDDEQVTVEDWHFGSVARKVVIGNATFRGSPPNVAGDPSQWFPLLESGIRKTALTPDCHWIRFYYAHLKGLALDCEVLVDNENSASLRELMLAFPWPTSEGFYSARIFLIVQRTGASPCASSCKNV